MGAILDKIRELKARKEPQVKEEGIKSEPMLLGTCPPPKRFFSGEKSVYAFYISDVRSYDSDRADEGIEGIIAFSSTKDNVGKFGVSILFDKKYVKKINDFALSNDPIKKECLIEAALVALDEWNVYKDDMIRPFYRLEEKYHLKKMKYAFLAAKRKVLGK